MENKYFLLIDFSDSKLSLFILYDYNKKKLYSGDKKIKSNYEYMTYKEFSSFLYEYENYKHNLFEISKKSFLTFINFDFSIIRHKKRSEIYSLIGLEEYAI